MIARTFTAHILAASLGLTISTSSHAQAAAPSQALPAPRQTESAPSIAPALSAWTESQLASIRSLGPWPVAGSSAQGTAQHRLNPLSGQPQAIALGKRLFKDPALSGNGSVSCATCHVESKAFSDGRSTATGIGAGHRNTPGLLDVAAQRWFGWDGGSDSLWAATVRPLLDPDEMASSAARVSQALSQNTQNRTLAASLLQRLRKLGGVWQSGSRDEQRLVLSAMSIAAWMEGLNSAPAAFDRYRDALALPNASERQAAMANSGFTAAAAQGLAIFIGKGNCIVCHGGPRFTHGEFHDIGIPFLVTGAQGSTVDPGRYRGIERVRQDPYNLSGAWSPVRNGPEAALVRQTVLQHRNWGEWKIPGLRNLRQTAPYMHNGSLASLRDVVEHYSQLNEERLHTDGEALLKPLRLTAQEVADLVTFLESLSPP